MNLSSLKIIGFDTYKYGGNKLATIELEGKEYEAIKQGGLGIWAFQARPKLSSSDQKLLDKKLDAALLGKNETVSAKHVVRILNEMKYPSREEVAAQVELCKDQVTGMSLDKLVELIMGVLGSDAPLYELSCLMEDESVNDSELAVIQDILEPYILGDAVNESDPSLQAPKKWWNKMTSRIKGSEEKKSKIAGSIWSKLSDAKKSEIRGREGKTYGPANEEHTIIKEFSTKDGGTAKVCKRPNGKFFVEYEGKELDPEYSSPAQAEKDAKKYVGLKEEGPKVGDGSGWPVVGDPIYYKNGFYLVRGFQGGMATLEDDLGKKIKVSTYSQDWKRIEDASDHDTDPAGGSGYLSHK